MKIYRLCLEAQLDYRAEDDDEALDMLNKVGSEDFGYYRIAEIDPDTEEEIRVVEEM